MSEPVVTSTSSNHSVPISKPGQGPHSVAHETAAPESHPVGDAENGVHDPNDKAPGAPDEGYPPQLHAGQVGYGPHYAEVHGKETGLGAKMTGLKEQIKGKVTRNPDLEQRGHDRMTGELKAKEQAEEEARDPFATADEGKEKDGNAPPPPNAPNAASAQQTAP
ncbi:hypothetical protein RhiJN_06576 [Ceratobasidium sp. AG-Ba]|nr:hypothetical protein RhiJN_06576 [Ceratobasidium sp. AG-Ba]QRW07490.1 hypothetical protein RhiLY_06489 [Ceratobasidium sp. AG-Ba]